MISRKTIFISTTKFLNDFSLLEKVFLLCYQCCVVQFIILNANLQVSSYQTMLCHLRKNKTLC